MGMINFRSARPHEPPLAKRKCRIILRNSRSRSRSTSHSDAEYIMGLRKSGASREYDMVDTRFSETTSAMALALRQLRIKSQSVVREDEEIKAMTQSLAGGLNGLSIKSEAEDEEGALSLGSIMESTEEVEEISATEFILDDYLSAKEETPDITTEELVPPKQEVASANTAPWTLDWAPIAIAPFSPAHPASILRPLFRQLDTPPLLDVNPVFSRPPLPVESAERHGPPTAADLWTDAGQPNWESVRFACPFYFSEDPSCHEAFTTAKAARHHVAGHQDPDSINCVYPSCKSTYKRSDMMTRHLGTHAVVPFRTPRVAYTIQWPEVDPCEEVVIL